MSMLIVATEPVGAESSADVLAARSSAESQGFASPECFTWSSGAAWLYPTPGQPKGSGSWVRLGGRFAAATGAFHWRGLTGSDALTALLRRDDPIDALPWDEISGAYLLLLGRDDGVWLVGDALGLMKAYEVEGGRLISTSMLACCAALKRLEVNRLRAQEYVLLGASHGLETALSGLRLINPTQARNLVSGREITVHAPQRLLGRPPPRSPDDATAAICAELGAEFGHMVQAHGPNIGMALSGGFDSRLLLAALDHVGVKPDLFVYGRAADSDVVVASAVARRLGLPITATDKSVQDCALAPLDTAKLLANLRFYDGLPVDGLFDRGCDQATRLKQVQAGRLNLNGGGGEILRNFFYLPDRRYSAAEVCSAFYGGWLDEVFLAPEERAAFVASVQDEILGALGRDHGTPGARARPMSRAEVELVYTLFRLRYWMGRNNSLFARIGAFMTPLATPALVSLAASVPMRWKEYGRLEAAVITRLSPRVASGTSSYGFAFDRPPTWRHRLQTAMTLYRPVSLRPYSLRVQKRLGRIHAPLAPTEWCAALGALPSADWLNPSALTGLDQLNRLMSIQALLSLKLR